MRCGLLGEHLTHSYSPQIHALLGDYSYELFEVAPEKLGEFLQAGEFDGLNVTIPYKRAVIPYCAELSAAAREMGCVNTLLRRPDGTLYGDNTDLDGFRWLLARGGGIRPGEKALVLGTGGASQTVQAVLRAAGAERVCGLDDILTAPVNGSGYNPDFGLLGTNKADEDTVKLFPRDCGAFVRETQKRLMEATGKHIEVMVYGDGAFKDPQGKIWELADPCVSPAYTDGLVGTPNELKLKYLADNAFKGLEGSALETAITDSIRAKDGDLTGNMVSEGTTPRQLTDLIGSLCDLTSGSGDKGTPIVLVQGYFDNFSNN